MYCNINTYVYTYGIYHDKLGILEDHEGDVVVFYGSANSSANGYEKNYECQPDEWTDEWNGKDYKYICIYLF